jgi:hypothetical protein
MKKKTSFNFCPRIGLFLVQAIPGNDRQPKSSLGGVFNFKLGRFVMNEIISNTDKWPCLEWMTYPWSQCYIKLRSYSENFSEFVMLEIKI